MATAFLDLLPNELLLMIKGDIPTSDLRTHVCFYKSCNRVASLYGSHQEQEEFFQKSLWLSGLGLLPEESLWSVSWKEIAFDCIEQDGFCAHPECGGDLLKENAVLMEFSGGASDMQAIELTTGVDVDGYCQDLFKHISFAKPRKWQFGMDPDCDAHLRPVPSIPAVAEESACYLAKHPIASRSFAAFPPITGMLLLYPFELYMEPELRNNLVPSRNGVTVWDVTEGLRRTLGIPLSVSSVTQFLYSFEHCVPKQWSFLECCERLNTMRGLLTLVSWDGMSYEGTDEMGPMYSFEFQEIEQSSPEHALNIKPSEHIEVFF